MKKFWVIVVLRAVLALQLFCCFAKQLEEPLRVALSVSDLRHVVMVTFLTGKSSQQSMRHHDCLFIWCSFFFMIFVEPFDGLNLIHRINKQRLSHGREFALIVMDMLLYVCLHMLKVEWLKHIIYLDHIFCNSLVADWLKCCVKILAQVVYAKITWSCNILSGTRSSSMILNQCSDNWIFYCAKSPLKGIPMSDWRAGVIPVTVEEGF